MRICGHKGGGTGVRSISRIRNLKEYAHLGGFKKNNFFVLSAIAGATRKLDHLFWTTQNDELSVVSKEFNCDSILDSFRLDHVNLIEELFGFNDKKYHEEPINDFMNLLSSLRAVVMSAIHVNDDSVCEGNRAIMNSDDFNHSYLRANILKYGELASSKIISQYFGFSGVDNIWLDSREFIKTLPSLNNDHTRALVDFEESIKLTTRAFDNSFSDSSVVICPGFIARDKHTGRNTLLGMDGSDYTAAFIGFALNAESVTFWKDVNGVKTGDPHKDNSAVVIPEMTHLDYIALYNKLGGGPIRKDAIKLLHRGSIPSQLRPFDNLTDPGTWITWKKEI